MGSLSTGRLARRRWSAAGPLSTTVSFSAGPMVRIRFPPAASQTNPHPNRQDLGNHGRSSLRAAMYVADLERTSTCAGTPYSTARASRPARQLPVELRGRDHHAPSRDEKCDDLL